MKIYRWLDKLNEDFRKKVELFLKEVNKSGKIIFITESFRTLERQKYLLWQGRNTFELMKFWLNFRDAKKFSKIRDNNWKKLKKVTWTLDSKHMKWQAVDIAFYWKELYPNDFSKWRKIANIAKKYSINWWYDLWKKDKPHFENIESTLYKRTQKAVSLWLIKVDENNKNDLIDRNSLWAIIYEVYRKIKEQK